MKFLALTLILFSSAFAHADLETKMATITSDIDNDTGKFYLLTDENGDVDALRYTITQSGGRILEDNTHPWERIRDGGVVLVERNGYEVLRLHLNVDFSPKTGGEVRVNYLFSGVTGARFYVLLNLVRENDAFVLTQNGKPVNALFIKGNWNIFLGLVGISSISTSFNPAAPLVYAHDSSPQ